MLHSQQLLEALKTRIKDRELIRPKYCKSCNIQIRIYRIYLNSGKIRRSERMSIVKDHAVVLPRIGRWFLQNLHKKTVSSGLQRLPRWLMAVCKCIIHAKEPNRSVYQVYHFNIFQHFDCFLKFELHSVTLAWAQATLRQCCVCSAHETMQDRSPCAVMDAIVAAFKVFRLDDFRWIYTIEVYLFVYYRVWYWDRLWVRYL